MNKDEALDLALEELENCADLLKVFEAPIDSCVGATMLQAEKAITAIKQARSAPVQEPDWSHAWLLIKAASYASSQGHISGTTNWGAAMSAYLRHESKAAAQPAPVQEPVAVIGSGFQLLYCREDWAKGLKIGDTLCLCTSPAAQRQWVDLTGDEIVNMLPDDDTPMSLGEAFFKFAELVEAKLKEKNT